MLINPHLKKYQSTILLNCDLLAKPLAQSKEFNKGPSLVLQSNYCTRYNYKHLNAELQNIHEHRALDIIMVIGWNSARTDL